MNPLELVLAWLVATAAAYAYDKLAAPRGARRVRERTLWVGLLLWLVLLPQ